ncbi:hypothetical protein M422DRAFT_233014, partial [Sphaerobolus stellatus SS14]
MAPGLRQNYARPRTKPYATPPTTNTPPMSLPIKQEPMPPSSRYLHNLRVIQRHDPTITSLFDQFPHVCLYHHKGDGWQKKGVEGAMFLFEREQEPKYGFYILNRNNTGDYIQRMTPDDDVEFANAYVIYRAFGKATSDTIGLWTMVTQDREAMSEVMMRLHGYIKRGERYPDVYRRRPETWSTTPSASLALEQSISRPVSVQNSTADDNSTTVLTNLLAKLDSSASSSLPGVQPPSRPGTASVPPPATGIPLLDSIFASASQDSLPEEESPAPIPNALQALFATAANGIVNGHISESSSSVVTPTQHKTRLPLESSLTPSKSRQAYESIVTPRSIIPMFATNGKAIATSESTQSTPGPRRVVPSGIPQQKRSASYQHTKDIAVNGLDQATEAANGNIASPTKGRSRNAKRRERRQRAAANGEIPQDNAMDWPLVDDRSLSVDGDYEDEPSGLGDGLLNAIAALSETESRRAPESTASPPPKKARSRDKRRRKTKEERQASSQPDNIGLVSPSSSPSPHPGDVGHVLMEVYGQRRRVGDPVLSEELLKKELLNLINNDPTFVRELHRQYLHKVQL